MRRAAKVDSNQVELVDALRKCGYSVLSLAAIGRGVPDLLVAAHGVTVLLELKDGSKSPSRRGLTDDQIAFLDTWRGTAFVVASLDEALGVMKVAVGAHV